MSTPEDIIRLKQLKESEALNEAWTRWKETRQVRGLIFVPIFSAI